MVDGTIGVKASWGSEEMGVGSSVAKTSGEKWSGWRGWLRYVEVGQCLGSGSKQ